MRQNKFFTLIFSCFPGAGHLYLGMMKKGIILMALFLGIGGISAGLRMEFLLFLEPVVWFYAFFDTFKMARLEDEEREYQDVEFYNAAMNLFNGNFVGFFEKRKKIMGGFVIFLGIYTLVYGVFLRIFRVFDLYFDDWIIRQVLSTIPNIVVVFLLFALGRHLLKAEDKEEDVFSDFMTEETMKLNETKPIQEEAGENEKEDHDDSQII